MSESVDKELRDLQDGTATPFWVRDLIRGCLDRDPVDVVSVLEVVTAAFRRRLDRILGPTPGQAGDLRADDTGLITTSKGSIVDPWELVDAFNAMRNSLQTLANTDLNVTHYHGVRKDCPKAMMSGGPCPGHIEHTDKYGVRDALALVDKAAR